MSKGRHRWKGACSRNVYGCLWAPRMDQWVRVFAFADDTYLMLDLDNAVLAPEPLRARLVRAVVEELREDDPFVTVAVGDARLVLTWEGS